MSQFHPNLSPLEIEFISRHARELVQSYPEKHSLDIGMFFTHDFRKQFGLGTELPPLNIFIDALDNARRGMDSEPRGHFNPYHPTPFPHDHLAGTNIPLSRFGDYPDNQTHLSDPTSSLTGSGTQRVLSLGSPLVQGYPASITPATAQMATSQPIQNNISLHEPSANNPAQIASTSHLAADYFHSVAEFDTQNTMELFFEEGEATVESGQIEDVPPKEKKPLERKNQFFPNRPTALNLWAKSESAAHDIASITGEVDEIIKEDPTKSSDVRMSLINKRRGHLFHQLPLEQKQAWEKLAKESDSKPMEFGSVDEKLALMKSKIQTLRRDGYEAFGFPFVGIVFAEDSEIGEPAATFYDCDGASNGRLGFAMWLLQEGGRRAQASFLAQLNRYARYVHEQARAPSGNRASSVAPGTKKVAAKAAVNPKAQMGPEWVAGLRTVPPLEGLTTQELRVLYTNALYDRWKRAGYAGAHVPWQRISDNNEHFIQGGVVVPLIAKPEALGKAKLHSVLDVFIQQQKDGLVDGKPTEPGLLFLPCGTGASFLPKAKRGVREPSPGTGAAASAAHRALSMPPEQIVLAREQDTTMTLPVFPSASTAATTTDLNASTTTDANTTIPAAAATTIPTANIIVEPPNTAATTTDTSIPAAAAATIPTTNTVIEPANTASTTTDLNASTTTVPDTSTPAAAAATIPTANTVVKPPADIAADTPTAPIDTMTEAATAGVTAPDEIPHMTFKVVGKRQQRAKKESKKRNADAAVMDEPGASTSTGIRKSRRLNSGSAV